MTPMTSLSTWPSSDVPLLHEPGIRNSRWVARAARKRERFGFTRIELLIVLAAVLVSVALLSVFVAQSRRVRSHLTCTLNMKMIGKALEEYAKDQNGSYPWQVSINDGGTAEITLENGQAFCNFVALSNYILAWPVVICPQDTRRPASSWATMTNTNVSYFVGLDSVPKLPLSIMAGDRNITAASGVILQWNPSAPPRWIKSVGLHGDKGHVVFSDGHVEELDSGGLSNALQRAGMSTNRFAVP
jgi:prepilin-type processing-associated H-X9-DG protein